jgi:hypothetical protein
LANIRFSLYKGAKNVSTPNETDEPAVSACRRAELLKAALISTACPRSPSAVVSPHFSVTVFSIAVVSIRRALSSSTYRNNGGAASAQAPDLSETRPKTGRFSHPSSACSSIYNIYKWLKQYFLLVHTGSNSTRLPSALIVTSLGSASGEMILFGQLHRAVPFPCEFTVG